MTQFQKGWAVRQPVSDRAGGPRLRREALLLGRAVHGFWRHGDLFSGAAISFYALFSLLPMTLLLLVGLQFISSSSRVMRIAGRLLGLGDTDIILGTVRTAYAQRGSFGWVGTVTLILAAAGVFGAVQVAFDRVWEVKGRIFHARFLIGIITMAASLLIFLGMLVTTATAFRLIRTSAVGLWLGWPLQPPSRTSGAPWVAVTLAQLIIFWVGYRFLPNVPIRWRDALPGALIAATVWQVITRVLGWYLGSVVNFATLYHSLGAIMALLVWVYGLACSFLLGAEFVAQRAAEIPGRGVSGSRPP